VSHGNPTDQTDREAENPSGGTGMGTASERRDSQGREGQGSQSHRDAEVSGDRTRGEIPTSDGNRWDPGHRQRVPRPVADVEQEVLNAFETGDPSIAYSATMRIVSLYGDTVTECARLRFVINFGTSVCDHCEGLKAGPGVVATCFQLRRCVFRNVREGDVTAKQSTLIDLLADPHKSS